MLLEMNQWHLGYSQLLSDCRSSGSDGGEPSSAAAAAAPPTGSILILCNPDTDAMAAGRMLSYALRADGAPYQLRPCGGYSQLLRILRKLDVAGNGGRNGHSNNEDEDEEDEDTPQGSGGSSSSSDVRAVVLLNLGATRNLTRLYTGKMKKAPNTSASNDDENENGSDSEDSDGDDENNTKNVDAQVPPLLPSRTRLYVLDVHRPYHLANVHADRSVVLFNDRNWSGDDGVPSDGDNLSGVDEEASDSDNSSEGGDGDSGDDEDNGGLVDSDDDDGEVEFDDGGEVQGRGRGRDWGSKGGGRQDFDNDDADDDDGEDDDGDDDADAADGGGGGGRRSKKRRTGSRSTVDGGTEGDDEGMRDDLQQDDGDDDDDRSLTSTVASNPQDDGGDQQPPGRRGGIDDDNNANSAAASDDLQTLQSARRNRIALYYATGAHHSSPISWISYTLLSTQLRFGGVGDLLWLACVGVTDAYLNGRLDRAGYAMFAQDLRNHVRRVYPDELVDRVGNATYAELLDGSSGGGGGGRNNNLTQIALSENGKVLTQNEFRFFLLRHTSLWNAMLYSPYVCTTMGLWRADGMGRWREMLAKMGMPLVECRQNWAFMKPGLKRRLREMIGEHAEEYGLEGISYTGFVRVCGYRSLLSASDMSYAVTALLECDTPATGAKDDSGRRAGREGEQQEEEEEDRQLIQSFNVAYDALGSNGGGGALSEGTDLSNLVNGGNMAGNTGVGAGIRLALQLQHTIIQTAVSLVDRNAITRLSHFRYAYLHCTSQGSNGSYGGGPTSSVLRGGGGGTAGAGAASSSGGGTGDDKDQPAHIFSKPLALTKLAHFLMDMHRTNQKWTGTKSRPLVLLAEKPQTSTYLVVGYEFPEQNGDVVRNHFGQNFELAAKTMRGTFKFDSFDSNVVEVKAADVQRFVEQLHYMMDSM